MGEHVRSIRLKAHVIPKKRNTSVTRRQHFEVFSIKFHGSQELLELEPADFF